jgi:hypothetical protein
MEISISVRVVPIVAIICDGAVPETASRCQVPVGGAQGLETLVIFFFTCFAHILAKGFFPENQQCALILL